MQNIVTKTKISLLFCLLLSYLGTSAQFPKYEVRAVWLATIGGIDWPHSTDATRQQQELKNILDQLKHANINTVLVQTRVRASTIYPSSMEPFDLCLTGRHGKHPGYDPLKMVVDECHRRGMECHAWMVTLPIGKWKEPRCKEFVGKHPGMTRRIGDDGYMNPEDPRTGDYLARICAEVTSHYDIDGIHLDYIRYPETWKLKIPKQQARNNITSIVRKIHNAVKREKPWVKLSCSPVGKFRDVSRYSAGGWNAYNAVCQDAQGWLREGLMDQLYPMMYFKGNQFFPFAVDWKEHSYGRMVVPGLGIYFLHPKEGKWTLDIVQREMNVLRQEGMGHCFFRSKFLTDNTRSVYDFTLYFNKYPAVIPPMSWLHIAAPSAPATLEVRRGATSDELRWTPATDYSDGPYLIYNVYASSHSKADTEDATQLIATRTTEHCLSVPHAKGARLSYAVTAVDRYGNEGKAIEDQVKHHHAGASVQQKIECVSSEWIALPQKPNTLDAEYILLETLQGQIVSMHPYQGQRISISNLPDGIYRMKSLGNKGITHSMGIFAVKRRNPKQ